MDRYDDSDILAAVSPLIYLYVVVIIFKMITEHFSEASSYFLWHG